MSPFLKIDKYENDILIGIKKNHDITRNFLFLTNSWSNIKFSIVLNAYF